jgi:hypothetical protein
MSNVKDDNIAASRTAGSKPAAPSNDVATPLPGDPFAVFSEWAGEADRLAYESLALVKVRPGRTKPRR